MTTRQEHMDWCKRRALEYCDAGDPGQAIVSMLSDLGRHDETRNHLAIMLTMPLMMGGHLGTVETARKHIEGFN